MIHHVEGVLAEKPAGRLVVDVGGIGLELNVSNETWNDAGILGARVRLLTHLSVREDAWTLFGFMREDERALFRLLTSVQGVGPRLAIAVLSGLASEQLRSAVGAGDVAALTTISGVGKKTAERIVVDLRDKVGTMPGVDPLPAAVAVGPGGTRDDAVDALVALGYPRTVAAEAVAGARRAGDPDEPVSPEEMVKEALRRL